MKTSRIFSSHLAICHSPNNFAQQWQAFCSVLFYRRHCLSQKITFTKVKYAVTHRSTCSLWPSNESRAYKLQNTENGNSNNNNKNKPTFAPHDYAIISIIIFRYSYFSTSFFFSLFTFFHLFYIYASYIVHTFTHAAHKHSISSLLLI